MKVTSYTEKGRLIWCFPENFVKIFKTEQVQAKLFCFFFK